MIYIDGVLDVAVAASGTINTNNQPLQIGRNSEVAGREFNGAIYNVVVYAGAIDAATMQMLAKWDALIANWKLTEANGTQAVDSSPAANHGTYTNGVALAAPGPFTGLGGYAADFDGTNDYVESANEFYDIASPISVAAWIKVDSFNKPWQAICTKGDNSWRLQRYNNTNFATFAVTGLSAPRVTSLTSVADGRWHHVVGMYTGSQLQIYIDGVLDNTIAATDAMARNNYNVQIGQNAQQSGRNFDGSIYDVRVYSVALSPGRVSALYGLIGDWPLSETAGVTAADASPCGHDGTVMGGSNWSTRCNGSGTLDFNGSSQYISIPNSPHLQPTSMLSISAWIKGDSWGSGDSCDAILRKGEANPNNYQLAIADGKVALYLDANDNAGIRSNAILATGRWYHVAGTWDGVTARIYIDGVVDASAPRSGTIASDTRPVFIGGRHLIAFDHAKAAVTTCPCTSVSR